MVGWILASAYVVGASMVAVGWAGYFAAYLAEFGFHIPAIINSPTFKFDRLDKPALTGSIINVPAIVLVASMTWLALMGIKESTKFNNIMVSLKVSAIALVIVFGLLHVDYANWDPFIPENLGTSGHYGWSGVFRGVSIAFTMYMGFDAITTVAHETKNPKRDLPVAIVVSLSVCGLCYVLMSLVLTGLVNYSDLAVPHPIYLAVENMGAEFFWLRQVVNLAAIFGLASVVLVLMIAQPRIIYAMARDGLFPPAFAKLHSERSIPFIATLGAGAVACTLAGVFSIDILSQLLALSGLSVFGMVCLGLLVLRRNRPDEPRPFKVPLVPFIPLLGLIVCIYLMAMLPIGAWISFLFWLVIGAFIYGVYGRRAELPRDSNINEIRSALMWSTKTGHPVEDVKCYDVQHDNIIR
jgi:APA family basic amino acid/polyamine antiporter